MVQVTRCHPDRFAVGHQYAVGQSFTPQCFGALHRLAWHLAFGNQPINAYSGLFVTLS
jgi:hypothetical protein